MKEFFKVVKRFVPPYRQYLVQNLLFNVLTALLSAFSFVMLIPVLNILFDEGKEVILFPEWSFDFEYIKQIMGYYVTQIKHIYGIETTLLVVGGFYIIAIFLKVSTAYLASYSMVYIQNGVVRDIRNQIYNKVLELPLSFFSKERKGDVIARVTGDVTEVRTSIMSSLDAVFKNPIIIICALGMMTFMSWKLTLFVLIILPLSGMIIGRVGKSLKRSSMEGQNKMGDLLTIIDETLSGHRIVKAFNAEYQIYKHFKQENNNYRRIMNKIEWRYHLAHPVSEILGSITIIILLWYGGRLILSEEANFGAADFIAYLALFYSIINPAKNLSNASYTIRKGLASIDRIDKILNAESDIKEIDNPLIINDFNDKIVYSNVSFSYDGKVDVLKQIYVEIKKGQTVALVGDSGSGKTTFADLLPRFYDVSGGRITIDGVDIRKIGIHSLRGLMGNVNQDPILFNNTFYNNITFGTEGTQLAEVEKSAKIANAHDFIINTHKGYQSNIGDSGGMLSGGQRQRVSIARAVLKNPPIMILDEATSALDTKSEKYVQDALDNLMKDRTSIVIAHRLSTIRNADIILVFKDGRIVEVGTHEELIKQNGEYKKLYSMQNINN